MSSLIEDKIRMIVRNLESAEDPLSTIQRYTSYEFNKNYDIVVTVNLLPKKSQKEIGEEMFGVSKPNQLK
jgi:hypothetical protein